MPVIHVDILEGRTIAQKRAYIKALTEVSVKHLGCRPENVAVVLADMPFEPMAGEVSPNLKNWSRKALPLPNTMPGKPKKQLTAKNDTDNLPEPGTDTIRS